MNIAFLGKTVTEESMINCHLRFLSSLRMTDTGFTPQRGIGPDCVRFCAFGFFYHNHSMEVRS